jgi:hypothetical protein
MYWLLSTSLLPQPATLATVFSLCMAVGLPKGFPIRVGLCARDSYELESSCECGTFLGFVLLRVIAT